MIKEAYTRKQSLSQRSAKANGEEGGEKSTAYCGTVCAKVDNVASRAWQVYQTEGAPRRSLGKQIQKCRQGPNQQGSLCHMKNSCLYYPLKYENLDTH